MAFIFLILSGVSLLMSLLFFVTGEWLFGIIMGSAVFYFHSRYTYSKQGKSYYWICPHCRNRNPYDLQACTKCGTHR